MDVDGDFPQTFPVIAPDSDGSSENWIGTDVVRQLSAGVRAVDSPLDAEILIPNRGEGLRRGGWGVLRTGLHDGGRGYRESLGHRLHVRLFREERAGQNGGGKRDET